MKKFILLILCFSCLLFSACSNNGTDTVSRKEIEVLMPNGTTASGELPETIDQSSVGVETQRPTSKNYVGSKTTKKYHRSSCSYAEKIKAENKVYFSTKNDFLNSGYSPCKSCKP